MLFPIRLIHVPLNHILMLGALLTPLGAAQTPAVALRLPPSPGPILPLLQRLIQHAPVIFSGEVLTMAETTGGIAVVRIRIDRGIRGVNTGDMFSFGQWRTADMPPLFLHQRVIVFLRRPNAAGITSAVYGSEGILTIGGGGLVSLRSFEGVSQVALIRPGAPGDCRAGEEPPGIRGHPARLLPCLPMGFPPVLSVHPGSPTVLPHSSGNVISLPAQQLLDLVAQIVLQQKQLVGGITEEAADAH